MVKTDAEIIDQLGGATKVAAMLDFRPESGVQRVQNWKKRGIPAVVRLRHIEIFGIPAAKNPQKKEVD